MFQAGVQCMTGFTARDDTTPCLGAPRKCRMWFDAVALPTLSFGCRHKAPSRSMKMLVVGNIQKFKILKAVIKFVTVAMVDMFAPCQRAVQGLLHDVTVKIVTLAVDRYIDIAVVRDATRSRCPPDGFRRVSVFIPALPVFYAPPSCTYGASTICDGARHLTNLNHTTGRVKWLYQP